MNGFNLLCLGVATWLCVVDAVSVYRRPYGSRIDANTHAEGVGHYTNSFGRSDVNSGPFGDSGSVRHSALGVGRGHTAARSGGRIRASGPYGVSGTGSDVSASAYGNLNSLSRTSGGADYVNGFGHSGASSVAQGSGFGYSNARTSASSYRHKRHVSYPRPIGDHINANTDAEAFGGLTNSFGSSSVHSSPFGSHGSFTHGAEGVGVGATGARSRGRVGGLFGGQHSSASSNAYGNLGSRSATRGSGHYNSHGFGGSSSGAIANGHGFGHSASRTSASSSGMRYKRSTAPQRYCVFGRCYTSIDAFTKGQALGDYTESSGDAAINAQPGSLFGIASHQSLGRGFGQTGASSASKMESQDQWGFETFGSSSGAEALGDMSESWTKSQTRNENGVSFTQASSSGRAAGRGRSVSRSSASASRQRGKRDTAVAAQGELCVNGQCRVDRLNKGQAVGDSIQGPSGHGTLELDNNRRQYGLAVGSVAGREHGQRGVAAGRVEADDDFGHHRGCMGDPTVGCQMLGDGDTLRCHHGMRGVLAATPNIRVIQLFDVQSLPSDDADFSCQTLSEKYTQLQLIMLMGTQREVMMKFLEGCSVEVRTCFSTEQCDNFLVLYQKKNPWTHLSFQKLPFQTGAASDGLGGDKKSSKFDEFEKKLQQHNKYEVLIHIIGAACSALLLLYVVYRRIMMYYRKKKRTSQPALLDMP